MKDRDSTVKIINIIITLLTLIFFVFNYWNIAELLYAKNVWLWLLLIFAVFIVHAIKAFRLYLIFFGTDISFKSYLKLYCNVTPASMVLPFKSGEFFRMYRYGCELGNIPKGMIIVLLDRFMDTMALIVAIATVYIFNQGPLSIMSYFLIIFLLLMLLIYFVYPGLYKYWKKILLRTIATPNKLKALNLLEKLQFIYKEIEILIKGKGIILFFLSLVAWSVEIGYVAIMNIIAKSNNTNQVVSTYLASAIGIEESNELRSFVFVSVIGLLFLYVILKAWLNIRKKNKHENNSDI